MSYNTRDARGNVYQEDIRIVEPDARSERSSRREPEEERKVAVRPPPQRAPVREQTNINIELELPSGLERRLVVPAPPKPKPKEMWTEVTKDLVSREAIEKVGYEFDETDDFFYVLEYLQYVRLYSTSPAAQPSDANFDMRQFRKT